MHAMIADETADFHGIKIDTGANKMSILSLEQFTQYCRKFGLEESIDVRDRSGVRGIGGNEMSVGTAAIQIPFKDLGIVIDIRGLLLTGRVPTLLCLNDIYKNRLDISIKTCRIICGKKEQDLVMRDYLLVQKWEPTDMPFVYYTGTELRTIHRSFGHPEFKATEDLLRRARGNELHKNQERDCQYQRAMWPMRNLCTNPGEVQTYHRGE